MRLWRITDEEFVARVRRWHRLRRLCGALLLLVGVAFGIVMLIWGQRLSHRSLDLINSLVEVDNPSAEQRQQLADASLFHMGLFLGSAISTGVLAGGMAAGTGLSLVVGTDRKNRLLLDCWDERRGPLPPPASVDRYAHVSQ